MRCRRLHASKVELRDVYGQPIKNTVQPIHTRNQGVSPRCSEAFLLAHNLLLEHKAAIEFRKCSAKSAVLRSSLDTWHSKQVCSLQGQTRSALPLTRALDKLVWLCLDQVRSTRISAQGIQARTCMGHEADEPWIRWTSQRVGMNCPGAISGDENITQCIKNYPKHKE